MSVSRILLELTKTAKRYWNISPELGSFLNLLILTQNYKTILEVGTSNGYSGIWMAAALKKTGGKLYTIESHQKERYRLASKNFQKIGLQKQVVQILGHAPEAIPQKPEKFDLIFLDATKMEYPQYFTALKNRVKAPGLIIADNIRTHPEQTSAYQKLVHKTAGWQNFALEIGSGILISYKK